MNPMMPADPLAAPMMGAPVQPEFAAPMVREEPEDNEQRKALIVEWTRRIQNARKHWDRKFKQVKRDADFARGKQWPGEAEPEDETNYVANIVQRHIAQRVASLYAKNPRFIARRRKQLDFRIWDESPQSYMEAMQQLQMIQQSAMAGQPLDPVMVAAQMQGAMAVLKDAQDGKAKRAMLDKIGKTLEVLFTNQVNEQQPPFKKQMKQLVRRVLTTSVGWVKLGYERVMEPRPEDADKIRDVTTQLTDIEQRMASIADDEYACGDLELQKTELNEILRVVRENPQMVVREGLVFDFPPPNSVVVDTRCRQLQGFVGARWVAQEFNLPPSEVERIYGVDVKSVGFQTYRENDDGNTPQRADYSGITGATTAGGEHANSLVRVYEIQDKQTKTTFTIAEGCPVYLKEPAEPDVTLDRFWNLFCLTFNDIEHESMIYPPSDVELMRHMQLEHNRARQALREHRQAAAPMYAAPRGALSEDDKKYLSAAEPHSTVELDGLSPTQKVGDILQQVPKHGIDQNLYETNSIFDDILKVNGVQEAQIGGTSGATATEVSTAEGARMASVASNVDDLDDFFNELARAASQILLKEFDIATVQKICGPGSVWPQLSAQDIADELLLEVEAGSSGKPNRAADIKNFVDLAPTLMQIPGITPEFMAREAIKRMDDRLDLTDGFLAGLPSITSMNAAQPTPGVGGPDDPNAQGAEGANNAPSTNGATAQPNMMPAAGASPVNGGALAPNG
jgi:hypothetical protein